MSPRNVAARWGPRGAPAGPGPRPLPAAPSAFARGLWNLPPSARAPQLLLPREVVQAEIDRVVHVVVLVVVGLTAGTAVRASVGGRVLRIRVADEVAVLGAPRRTRTSPREGVLEAKVVTDLVRARSATVVRTDGGAVSEGLVEDDHAILDVAVDVRATESRHVSEGSTRGVGVDVQIPLGGPGETVEVVATVVEPRGVLAVGDSVRGIPLRIHLRQEEFDLAFVSALPKRSRNRVEVLVQGLDLVDDARLGDESLRSAGVLDDVDHDRNPVGRPVRGVVDVVEVRPAARAVGRRPTGDSVEWKIQRLADETLLRGGKTALPSVAEEVVGREVFIPARERQTPFCTVDLDRAIVVRPEGRSGLWTLLDGASDLLSGSRVGETDDGGTD